jgi:type VI secretion system protein ImpH
MPTSSRRKDSSITRQCGDQPTEFSFFQLVRLLERASFFDQKDDDRALKPVAGFVPPTSELIRFRGSSSLSFPGAEVTSVERRENQRQWDMRVTFMGLTGAMGVLPYHYSELILQRLKLKDSSLAKFFDLFNHRTVSLFYQAAVKYRLPIEYERKQLNPPVIARRDHATQSLLSLIGLGTGGLTERQYTRDESLLYYSGLLTQQIRSSSALATMLQHHFEIPVSIKDFVGQWQELIDDVRTMLPDRLQTGGRNNQLGRSAMLGRHGWFAQGKFRIVLGPLNTQQLDRFAPGTPTLKALNEIVKFYTGLEHDYEFVIRVKRRDIPEKIQLSKSNPSIIGWNTWLASKPLNDKLREQTLDIVVSGHRFG